MTIPKALHEGPFVDIFSPESREDAPRVFERLPAGTGLARGIFGPDVPPLRFRPALQTPA